MKDLSSLASLDATAQAALVRRGDVSATDLVQAATERMERLNPRINAVIIPLFEKAMEVAARGGPDAPFRGVPIVLKDIQPSEGDPMHAGMKLLREIGWVADHDAHIVAKLKTAGFVIVGKANLPELEGGVSTEPRAYGPTRNPWNLEHSAGGSSGGSAAAVASRMVPVAHGTDSGGSIRIPASECGIVGLKPSRGRVSAGPDFGDLAGSGAFSPHVLTRSVRDTAAVLDAIHGWMPGDPYTAPSPARPFLEEVGAGPGKLRVALWTGEGARGIPTHPDCVAATEEAGRLLESLGHAVEKAHPKALEGMSVNLAVGAGVTFAWYLDHWSARTGRTIGPEDVEPLTWAFAQAGRAASGVQVLEVLAERDRNTREIGEWWARGYDLLLTPTLAVPPPRLGECIPQGDDLASFAPMVEATARFTSPFNFTGQPAISLPLFWNEAGLPIGIHLVAAYGREDLLLRVSAQLEEARPWAKRHPPEHA